MNKKLHKFIKEYIKESVTIVEDYGMEYDEDTNKWIRGDDWEEKTDTKIEWYCLECGKTIEYESSIIYHLKSYHKELFK